MGLPEPPDQNVNDNVTNVNQINVINEADSDEDAANEYDGYTLLPLGPEETFSDDDDVNNAEAQEDETDQNSLPAIVPMDNVLVGEVWGKQTECSGIDIEMDSDKVNEVKLAMSNFTLPSTSIPQWANAVPEELWKENLIERLKDLNKKV